jgi:ribosomal protein S18 acetylase RimI-like enzyme
MSNSKQHDVVLVDSKDVHDFLPLMRELKEFGEAFLLTMLRWCGYGRERVEPLPYWQVFIAKIGSEPVAVTGLYRQVDTPKHTCWIGWFGVRPGFRRQGIGTKILEQLKGRARNMSCKEIWVYTESRNVPALTLYKKSGFLPMGTMGEVCPSCTTDPSDIVLKCKMPVES